MPSKDTQTVLAGGGRAASPRIAGVQIHELGNILTRKKQTDHLVGVGGHIKLALWAPAGYLNLTNELYAHEDPDNWRAAAGSVNIPDIL